MKTHALHHIATLLSQGPTGHTVCHTASGIEGRERSARSDLNRHPAHGVLSLRTWLASLVVIGALSSTVWASDEDGLGQRADWQPPAVDQLQVEALSWVATRPADDPVRSQIIALWAPEALAAPLERDPTGLLERIVESWSLLDPRVAALRDQCGGPWKPDAPDPSAWLQDTSLPSGVRANLRLFYARWLAHEQLYAELHEVLREVTTEQVVDPAALLFFQGVGQHRQRDREACLATLHRLLADPRQVPPRYLKLAQLMQADLEPYKPDSLDEIARMMDGIHVTLGHGRAGKQVRSEEDEVVKKLDKLIEQLEEQANAQASSGAAGDGQQGNSAAQPMQDSQNVEQKGPGNVKPKDLGTDTNWGNLPPKEREEALQQLVKDLPSHYREVIEEYFRKLAREREEP